MVIIGLTLLLNFLFRFLSTKSYLDLFLFLPLFIIVAGVFINKIYSSKRFFTACICIIALQIVIWILSYLYSPFDLSIEFYTQLGALILILLLLMHIKRKKLQKGSELKHTNQSD